MSYPEAISLDGQGSGFVLRCDFAGQVPGLIVQNGEPCLSLFSGRSLHDSVDPDSRQKLESFLEAANASGFATGWEMNLPYPDGLRALMFAAIREENGFIIAAATGAVRLVCLLEDLARSIPFSGTESAKSLSQVAREVSVRAEKDGRYFDELTALNNELAVLQRELSRKNAELEKLNALKDQFLGMAAHDLRSPLGSIMMCAEMLREAEQVLDEEQRGYLAAILASSGYMLTLVEEFLDLSVIESGRLELNIKASDLNALVEAVIAQDGVLAEGKGVRLQIRRRDAPTIALFDPDRIRQVLTNLVNNAVKFSVPGGSVEISVDVRESEAIVSVKDEGTGIPRGRLKALFSGLSVKSTKGTCGEKGTGLGLAICRRIVDGHSGRIEAESEPGTGTTIRFTLPLA